MNYSQFTLDQLFDYIAWLNRLKSGQPICGLKITQRGIDRANQELSAIEAELDERQPVGDFVTLVDGFEPIEYSKAELAQQELDDVDLWADYGFTVGSFL